jgi:hypothetical protein
VVPFALVSLDEFADEVLLADDVADWLPVLELAVVLIDWSPVVALVLLVTDWSPVLVALSMVRLDRPRRSMLGEKVEVEPLTVVSVLAVEPVMAEFTLVLDPVTVGLLVAFAVEFDEVALLAEVLFAEEGLLAAVLFALDGLFAEEVALLACASGMQSWCTGLAECSFAMPVSLFASLPACGWPSSLQSGFVAAAAVALVDDLGVAVELADDLAVELPDEG